MRLACLLLLLVACSSPRSYRSVAVHDRAGARGPRVLCVCAHPDDETSFAATLYKVSTYLDGACDLVTITNGEGGFKYSTLAEDLYGVELTEEEVGREHLPAIRERELIEGLGYVHLRRLYLLEETDHRYTQDPMEVLAPEAGIWDLTAVEADLDRILSEGQYDFVFTHAPTPVTHGHHQAATILALRAVERLPVPDRPAILAAGTRGEGEPRREFTELAGFPETAMEPGARYSFDRTQSFGFRERLDYRIVVNWVIAAHKSQGTMQLYLGRGTHEDYGLFQLSGPGSAERATELFDRLAEPQFESKTYGASAGTNASGT